MVRGRGFGHSGRSNYGHSNYGHSNYGRSNYGHSNHHYYGGGGGRAVPCHTNTYDAKKGYYKWLIFMCIIDFAIIIIDGIALSYDSLKFSPWVGKLTFSEKNSIKLMFSLASLSLGLIVFQFLYISSLNEYEAPSK